MRRIKITILWRTIVKCTYLATSSVFEIIVMRLSRRNKSDSGPANGDWNFIINPFLQLSSSCTLFDAAVRFRHPNKIRYNCAFQELPLRHLLLLLSKQCLHWIGWCCWQVNQPYVAHIQVRPLAGSLFSATTTIPVQDQLKHHFCHCWDLVQALLHTPSRYIGFNCCPQSVSGRREIFNSNRSVVVLTLESWSSIRLV